ncbi:hypothetical protein HDU97_005180 [Phlyctochytrium planicorne]|nr:hypothetical protein HDU97_005180 [Phlyctochytrium planicorne]
MDFGQQSSKSVTVSIDDGNNGYMRLPIQQRKQTMASVPTPSSIATPVSSTAAASSSSSSPSPIASKLKLKSRLTQTAQAAPSQSSSRRDGDDESYIDKTGIVSAFRGDPKTFQPESSHQFKMPSMAVRIYVSSTYTDTQQESNEIVRMVALDDIAQTELEREILLAQKPAFIGGQRNKGPQSLMDLARANQIRLNVVEPHWGATDNTYPDPILWETCRNELERCRKSSMGLFFLSLASEKYGKQRTIPRLIAIDPTWKQLEKIVAAIQPNDPNRGWWKIAFQNLQKLYAIDHNLVTTETVDAYGARTPPTPIWMKLKRDTTIPIGILEKCREFLSIALASLMPFQPSSGGAPPAPAIVDIGLSMQHWETRSALCTKNLERVGWIRREFASDEFQPFLEAAGTDPRHGQFVDRNGKTNTIDYEARALLHILKQEMELAKGMVETIEAPCPSPALQAVVAGLGMDGITPDKVMNEVTRLFKTLEKNEVVVPAAATPPPAATAPSPAPVSAAASTPAPAAAKSATPAPPSVTESTTAFRKALGAWLNTERGERYKSTLAQLESIALIQGKLSIPTDPTLKIFAETFERLVKSEVSAAAGKVRDWEVDMGLVLSSVGTKDRGKDAPFWGLEDVEEVLFHAGIVRNEINGFVDRGDGVVFGVVDAVQKKLFGRGGSGWANCATALIGKSGSGKTAVMAKIASVLSERNDPNLWIITRSCGATQYSSTGLDLISGLCRHLLFLFNVDTDASKRSEDLQALLWKASSELLPTAPTRDLHVLTNLFGSMLAQLAGVGRKLVVMLDGLDQLSSAMDAKRRLSFLPKNIARLSNVHFIFSALPDDEESFHGPHTRLVTELGIPEIEVPELEAGVCLSIWSLLLTRENRLLANPGLASKVEEAISFERSPLFVHLLYHATSDLASFEQPENLSFLNGIAQAVEYIVDMVEKECGHPVLASRLLSYISFANHGVSENELMDLLSADDAVIKEAFKDWTPEIKRAPQLPVIHVLSKLSGYILKERSGLLRWSHPLIHKTLLARCSGKSSEVEVRTTMAEYFCGLPNFWGQKHANARRCHEGAFQHAKLVERRLRTSSAADLVRELCNLEAVEARAYLRDGSLWDAIPLIALAAKHVQSLPTPPPAAATPFQNTPEGIAKAAAESTEKFLKALPGHYANWLLQDAHLLENNPEMVFQQAERQPRISLVKQHVLQFMGTGGNSGQRKRHRVIPALLCRSSPALDEFKHLSCRLDMGSPLASVGISPLKDLAVAGGQDGSVHVMDAASGECRFMGSHATVAPVGSVLLVPDHGRNVVVSASSSEGILRIWDPVKAVCVDVIALTTIPEVAGKENFVKVLPIQARSKPDGTLLPSPITSGVIVAATSGSENGPSLPFLAILDVRGKKTKNRLWELTGFNGRAWTITHDGRRILGTTDDGKSIAVWNVSGHGFLERSLQGHSNEVAWISAAPAPYSSRAVSCGLDGTVRYWDLENGNCIESLELPQEVTPACVVVSMQAAKDKSVPRVAVLTCSDAGNENGRSKTSVGWSEWDLEGKWPGAAKIESAKVVVAESLNADSSRSAGRYGDYLAASFGFEKSETVVAWDRQNATQPKTSHVQGKSLLLSIDNRPKSVVHIANSAKIETIDLLTGVRQKVYGESSPNLTCFDAAFPEVDGSVLLVSGAEDKHLSVWRLGGKRLAASPYGPPTPVKGEPVEERSGFSKFLVFPGGQYIVSGNLDGSIRVWTVQQGKCGVAWRGHIKKVDYISWVKKGESLFVTASYDEETQNVKVWDTKTWSCTKVMSVGAGIKKIAIDPSGSFALISLKSGKIGYWGLKDAKTEPAWTLDGETLIDTVPFRPDHRSLLFITQAGDLKLWKADAANAAHLKTFEGHTEEVVKLTFPVQHGQTLTAAQEKAGTKAFFASRDAAGCLIVWDLEKGDAIMFIEEAGQPVHDSLFTLDGSTLFASFKDKIVSYDVESYDIEATHDQSEWVYRFEDGRTFHEVRLIRHVFAKNTFIAYCREKSSLGQLMGIDVGQGTEVWTSTDDLPGITRVTSSNDNLSLIAVARAEEGSDGQIGDDRKDYLAVVDVRSGKIQSRLPGSWRDHSLADGTPALHTLSAESISVWGNWNRAA